MKQIFIYDQYGLELLSCQFAGMSEEGKLQLVVTTPGKTVQLLDDYTCHKEDYLMLCEGEKMANSRDVLRMFGCIYEGGVIDLEDGLKGRVDDMRRLGIDWNREPVFLTADVSEYKDQSNESRFSLWLMEGEHDSSCLAEITSYDTIDDLFNELREFFKLVEDSAGIKLVKHLVIRKDLEGKVRKMDLSMFNKIDEVSIEF